MALLKRIRSDVVSFICSKFSLVFWKEYSELRYWRGRKNIEGSLDNRHYEYFYTTHFGMDRLFYENKIIVDIGCGPRGSLEWANMCARRIGVDPLSNEYAKLGTSSHKMEYLCVGSENIPLADSYCDAIFSFNSLDHVEDIGKTISEIKRLTKNGGLFLLLVEINHAPTVCEPHNLTVDKIVSDLSPEFECESLDVFTVGDSGIYDAIKTGEVVSNPYCTDRVGYLSAKFIRN